MRAIKIFVLLIAVITNSPSDTLTGRWESKPSKTGNVTSILFKQDNNFEGFVNKKPFVTGKYLLQDSIFSFTDNACNGVRGTYRIIFFSNADSLRFEPIFDSCTERQEGMKRLIMGKIK